MKLFLSHYSNSVCLPISFISCLLIPFFAYFFSIFIFCISSFNHQVSLFSTILPVHWSKFSSALDSLNPLLTFHQSSILLISCSRHCNTRSLNLVLIPVSLSLNLLIFFSPCLRFIGFCVTLMLRSRVTRLFGVVTWHFEWPYSSALQLDRVYDRE